MSRRAGWARGYAATLRRSSRLWSVRSDRTSPFSRLATDELSDVLDRLLGGMGYLDGTLG